MISVFLWLLQIFLSFLLWLLTVYRFKKDYLSHYLEVCKRDFCFFSFSFLKSLSSKVKVHLLFCQVFFFFIIYICLHSFSLTLVFCVCRFFVFKTFHLNFRLKFISFFLLNVKCIIIIVKFNNCNFIHPIYLLCSV